MGEDVYYRVGPFLVTLKRGDSDELRPWSHALCECEAYHKAAKSPLNQTPESKRCKHIREAELFHVFAERVTPIDK